MAKRLTSDEFKYVYTRVPRLCVDLVVKNKDGVLLTLRNIPAAKGYWHFPGGTVLHGENLQQACLRVGKEELGVKVKVIKQLYVIEYITFQANYGHAVSVAFLVNLDSSDIKLNQQASDFKFFRKVPDKALKEIKKIWQNL